METSYYPKDMEECMTVVDVYDSAALIGKDFEYLIEQYGVEAVTDLMPKVIRVLEQLEHLATKHEKENEEMLQMEATIRRLNIEKEERSKERQQYEKELEQIEESYRKESKDLYQMVANLQEQNKRLMSRLNEKATGQEAAVEKTQEDFNVIQTLKETVAKQRGQIKGLQTEIKQKDGDLDAVRQQLDRVSHDNATLHAASNLSQSQSQRLLAEHESLQTTIKEKDLQIKAIRDRITQQEKAQLTSSASALEMNAQVMQMSNSLKDNRVVTHIKTMQAKQLINEKSELQTLLQDKNQQLRVYEEKAQSDQVQGEDKTNIIGQMVQGHTKGSAAVAAPTSPDNPRFTLNELKDILTERNTLKSKLFEIEEELCYYKNKDKTNAKEAEERASWLVEEQAMSAEGGMEDSFIGEVQGPINREPYEKIYGKPESGIRKFFERFPVELPETIKVNIIPEDLASYAQARASSFWDLRMTRSSGPKTDSHDRPKSYVE